MPDGLQVLVRQRAAGREIALLKERQLVEYYQEEALTASVVGAIMLGRIERVLPKLGAAFIEIGQKLNGFLPLSEMESFEAQGLCPKLVTGQDVLVQVKKDAKGDKGAFLTRDISLPGQFCVVMPFNRHIGVSSRIQDEEARAYARSMGEGVAQGRSGIIVRNGALTARKREVQDEYEALLAVWNSLLEKAPYTKAPAAIHQETSALQGLLRDYGPRFTLSVLSDSEEALEIAGSEGIDAARQTTLEMEALWNGAGIPGRLKAAISRRVETEKGGTLVIDEREALVTIDVNTAKYVGGTSQGDIALEHNLRVCPAIAREIRLRNLSGIILIDFIDMKTDAQRQAVQETLESALKDDRIKTVIHGFTSLGLLEMTRKRSRETLQDRLTEPCSSCHGSGRRLIKD